MKHCKEDILFVNPPLSCRQRYGVLAQSGPAEPPIGLAYLAATTRRSGYGTAILDAQALGISLEECLDLILGKPPDFLAITMVTMSVKISSMMGSLIKERLPDIKIIVGGPHFTSLPVRTMLENDCFDVGVIGEGEKTLEDLLRAFSAGTSLSTVPGIAFKQDKQVFLTVPRQRITDLDELPMPAFDLLPELKRYYRATTQSIKYLPTASLVTSRGCSGRCLFCDRKTFSNELRMHSAEYVSEMMLKLQKDFGIRGIIFEEDNFMLSEKRLSDLAELIHRKRIRISWSALSRVNTVSRRKLEIAKSCGCWQILYGIESGSQSILNFYQKEITIGQIREAVALTKNCGIYVKGLFILGNPTESAETLKETRNFIMDLPLDDISLTFFTPYPGAEICGKILEYGEYRENWEKLTCFDIVFVPNDLSAQDIIDSQKSILKEFYSRKRVILSYLTRLRSFSQLKELYISWRSLSLYSKSQSDRVKFIVNADDFGLCEDINAGILKAFKSGVVRSVSLMPNGYAFESAVEIIKSNPQMRVGVHLSLHAYITAEKNLFIFLTRYFSGKIRRSRIFEEFESQIKKARDKNIKISHLDAHQHIHILPGIFKITVLLARKYKIPLVRIPSVPLDRRYLFSSVSLNRKIIQLAINFLSPAYKFILKRNGIGFYDYSFGFLESGRITAEEISRITSSLRTGFCELICHPAIEGGELRKLIGHWRYGWQRELEALTSYNAKQCLYFNEKEFDDFSG